MFSVGKIISQIEGAFKQPRQNDAPQASAGAQPAVTEADLRKQLAAANARIANLENRLKAVTLYPGEPDYRNDYLAVWQKSVDHFMANPRFLQAYKRGVESGHAVRRPGSTSQDIQIEWRVLVCIWAAAHAANLEGDFVECGVNTGIYSIAICDYLDFNKLDKNFWLLDTYEGSPVEQMTGDELERYGDRKKEQNARIYFECYDLAKSNFAAWPRALLVRGMIPDTLGDVGAEKIAYLSIDMNFVAPERAALEYFWPKMVRGGIVVFDDYGWKDYRLQKDAHDEWAARNGVEILLLPTGQGLLIKP